MEENSSKTKTDHDPGPADSETEKSCDKYDLNDQFQQQQVLIAQLREVIKKSENANVTQEKVDRYASALSKMTNRAKKIRKEGSGSSDVKSSESSVAEKMNLLKMQMEENKAKLAERGKSQRGIEEKVTQLKAQFDDSFQLIQDTSINYSLDTKIDYSKNNSSEELYNILLSKEKRISDLMQRVQKLEGTVLDLQENVKEKDCVIDARTKAITLMTESLTKKGKNTLDSLEDTKEQMKKMQENFVTLENEMKARQIKLLDDLKIKNIEIAELRDINDSLSKKLEELGSEKQVGDENEQVIKLKKQLEESNKAMIKSKAEHKNKIKSLNKKIDSFKKIGDINAHVVKLEDENNDLKEKIAELEAEKGNYQLQLIEARDTTQQKTEEPDDTFLQKLEKQSTEISDLTLENDKLKQKIASLTEKQNDQVSSEINSIHYEETLDRLNSEKLDLETEKETLRLKNEELVVKIEELNQEKQDLQLKLDHYMHENIELIDKLEKLSVEKVSSAESIEIVENLTQQEKLELEAFQKNLDVESGKLKTSEENLEIANEVDLNDSVNQLNEETSELLQRIELFTVERREVMEKMEFLSNENNNLNLKLRQIENNHEVLTETYEQLQSEKEILDNKISDLEKENEKLKSIGGSGEIEDLQSKLNIFEVEYEKLTEKNNKLSKELTEKSRVVEDLKQANNLIENLEIKLMKNVDEIECYKGIIEDNKGELINSATLINKLQEDINAKELQLEECKKVIEDLISKKDDDTVENLTKQLEQLKTTLNDNLDQINEYEKELEENSVTISNLNIELKHLSQRIAEHEYLLTSKNEEINILNAELSKKNYDIQSLEEQIKSKDEIFHKVTNDLKEKIMAIQKRTESNSDSLETIKAPMDKKIEELTTKNHNLVEKMKKLAANLKKKTQICQELEDEHKSTKEKWESEINEKDERIKSLEEQCQLLINRGAPLQSDKIEVSLHEELSGTQEALNISSDSFSKIQELEMIIETLENDITNYKERISHLEEDLQHVHERKESLEKKTNKLGAELQEKSQSLEEICQSEDILEQKLREITQKKVELEKKLEEIIEDNKSLTEENQQLHESIDKLKQKLDNAQEKVNELLNREQQLIVELKNTEEETNSFKRQGIGLEQEIKRLENEKIELMEASRHDLEKLDSDWQTQFKVLFTEKNEMNSVVQNMQEYIKELNEKENSLQEEIRSFNEKLQRLNKDQLIRDNELTGAYQDLENLKMLVMNKEKEINHLSDQLTERSTELISLREYLDTEKKRNEELTQTRAPTSENNQTTNFFQWPSSPNPFDQIGETQMVQNTEEELLQKIKTLEFMLKNVEIERDEVLSQCATLSNELSTLVYQKESKVDVSTEPHHQTDYQHLSVQTDEIDYSSMTPVQEAPFVKDEAYLLYPKQIESQVLPSDFFNETKESRKDLQDLEFTKTKDYEEHKQPVKEEQILKQQTYLCHPESEIDAFGENDDGWGFGAEETKAEIQHLQQQERNPLNSKVKQLEQEIQTLRSNKENREQEFREMQVKTSKLVKKLKELKAKNEQLTKDKKHTNNDMFDLENTIQEELKTQIEQLEKRIGEVGSELEKEKLEKNNLLKKIDVLTTANERMIEMKEKQDVELIGWQRRTEELKSKLGQFEWGQENTEESISTEKASKEDLDHLQIKIKELNNIIKELTLDNEDLQALLEEQRSIRVQMEREKSIEPIKENMIDQMEYLKVVSEKENLKRDLEDKRKHHDELNTIIKKNSEQLKEYEILKQDKFDLENMLVEKENVIAQLNNNLIYQEEYIKQITELQQKIEILEKNNNVEVLESHLSEQIQLLENVKLERDQLIVQLENFNHQKLENMKVELNERTMKLSEELKEQQKTIQNLLEENNRLNEHKLESEKAINNLTQIIQTKDKAFESQIVQMEEQWRILVDQRGSDVAESWKIHLDTRETEFEQLEMQLRKELNELEEKCNILVNENNELRKNVDAEIKNEVDKLTVFQQQITENQQYINELTKVTNDKQREIDEVQNQLQPLQNTILELQASIQDKDVRISELQIVVETTQKQFEEKQAIVEAVVRKLEERSGSPILFILTSILDELERQINTGEKDVHLERLTQELSEKVDIIADMEKQLAQLEPLQNEIIQRQNEVQNLNHSIVDLQQKVRDNEETIINLTYELEQTKSLKQNENENVQNLQHSLLQCHHQIEELQRTILEKEYSLEGANQSIGLLEEKIKEIEEKHNEEFNLLSRENERLLQQLNDHNQNNDLKISQYQHQVDDLMAEKEAALSSVTLLQNQMEEQNTDLNELKESLMLYKNSYAQLETKLTEYEHMEKLIEEKEALARDMSAMIEDQVAKIEELKHKLYEKSNDYDSLIAEMDMRKVNRHPVEKVEETDLVSRSELEIALYMLHQRDVRCEELTVELTYLLKERDTLQLRLSNTLREIEQLRKNGEGNETKVEQSEPLDMAVASSSTSSLPASGDLDNKLSELYGISYQKDKTLVDEQEQRRLQQMSIMHQHIEEASRLPPEAAARLVDARYTLSRDVQSPSKVLLNWLWGNSTPKVNDL